MNRYIFIFLGLLPGCLGTSPKSDLAFETSEFHAVYVDAKHGDDHRTGTSPTDAWKTFENIGNIPKKSGLQILLKKGQVWNETLKIHGANGAEGNPVIIGSYGVGERPVINGSTSLNGTPWKELPAQVWAAKLKKDNEKGPIQIFVGQKPLKGEHLKWSIDELTSDWDWHWSNDTIYLKLASSPASTTLSIDVNTRHYALDIRESTFVHVRDLVATRSRNGIYLECKKCQLENLLSTKNSLSGVIIRGSENSLRNLASSENGLVLFKNGKSERKGHGFEIDGGKNKLQNIIAENNIEDGIQFTETADSLNVIEGASLKGNGENCVDVKNGNQKIIGGTMKSDGSSSEDCIIAHKTEHTLTIDGVDASSTSDGPALSVFQGARINVKSSVFKSELSSAIYIDKSAGNGSIVSKCSVMAGGHRSGAVVDFQGGVGHKFVQN